MSSFVVGAAESQMSFGAYDATQDAKQFRSAGFTGEIKFTPESLTHYNDRFYIHLLTRQTASQGF